MGPASRGTTDNAEGSSDALEPGPELFPFCGSSSEDPTAPGEWPLDRQCILRLPEDVAERVAECLQREPEGCRDCPKLDLRLRPMPRQPGAPAGRRWEAKAFGEAMNATLVDLPCYVESHVLVEPKGSAVEDSPSSVAYKSADISQMLIVHRGPEPPDAARCLDRRTYEWCSGITPSTQRIRQRKFRGQPPPESEFAAERIAEAVKAIQGRMDNAPYVYEECSEVDEAVYLEILRTQPENIWRPPAPIRSSDKAGAAALGGEAVSSRVSASASAASGGTAPASTTQLGPREAVPSNLSTSSEGSGGGSAIAAMANSAKRKANSTISDGGGSGSTSLADGTVERLRRLRVK